MSQINNWVSRSSKTIINILPLAMIPYIKRNALLFSPNITWNNYIAFNMSLAVLKEMKMLLNWQDRHQLMRSYSGQGRHLEMHY
jgi:hypothetical protein